MLRAIIKCVILLLFVLFIASITRLGGAAMTVLPLGWLHFIARTLPNVTVNWSGIGMVVLCSALVVFGLQWFLSWLYRARPLNSNAPTTWRWRWTFALYSFFWLLFAIVMGASGLMRQTTWLVEFSEPLYKERINRYVELRQAWGEVETALLESSNDIQRAQRLLMSFRRNAPGAWDYHQFLFLTNADNHIHVAIIPRDPDAQLKLGFVLLGEKGEEHLPMTQLLTVLHAEGPRPIK